VVSALGFLLFAVVLSKTTVGGELLSLLTIQVGVSQNSSSNPSSELSSLNELAELNHVYKTGD